MTGRVRHWHVEVRNVVRPGNSGPATQAICRALVVAKSQNAAMERWLDLNPDVIDFEEAAVRQDQTTFKEITP